MPLFDDEQTGLLEEALAALPPSSVALRSQVSARLSVALSLAGHEARRSSLAESAVRLARHAGDGAALAAALAARCDAHAGPDHVDQRATDASAIVAVAHQRRDYGTELLGRRLRVVASLEAGDLSAVDRQIHEFARLAEWLRQPAYQWYVLLWRAMRAATRGRIDEQVRLAAEADELGHGQ